MQMDNFLLLWDMSLRLMGFDLLLCETILKLMANILQQWDIILLLMVNILRRWGIILMLMELDLLHYEDLIFDSLIVFLKYELVAVVLVQQMQ